MDKKSWFDAHIYDYLMKNNMHETANVFEREANLPSGALAFPVTDVPEGYLYKWWATYNEIYRKWQGRVPSVYEGSSNMVGGITNMRRQSDSSSVDREHTAGYAAPGMRDDTYNEGGAQGFLGLDKCLADLSWVDKQFKNEVLDISQMAEGSDSVFPAFKKTLADFSSLAEQFPNETEGKQPKFEPIELMNSLGSDEKSQKMSTL